MPTLSKPNPWVPHSAAVVLSLSYRSQNGHLVLLIIVPKKTKTSTELCRSGAVPRLLAWRLTQYISLVRTSPLPVGDVNEISKNGRCAVHAHLD